MQNAKGKCNRLSVKPFIATALFGMLAWGGVIQLQKMSECQTKAGNLEVF